MAGNIHDLTARDGVVAYMREATNEADWNARCDAVKRANGDYPRFWYDAVITSGVLAEARARWKRGTNDTLLHKSTAVQTSGD